MSVILAFIDELLNTLLLLMLELRKNSIKLITLGELMKLILKLMESGIIFTEELIQMETQ